MDIVELKGLMMRSGTMYREVVGSGAPLCYHPGLMGIQVCVQFQRGLRNLRGVP